MADDRPEPAADEDLPADPPDLFTPLALGDVTLPNRVTVSPMCQYSCDADGLATDWHRVHLGSRAVGGAGLVIAEATAVEARGRISPNDLGLWSDAHAEALSPVARFVREHGSVPAIQLAHAGRKASTRRPADGGGRTPPDEGGWTAVGPTDEPYPRDDPVPTERLSREGIATVVDAFGDAAARAGDAGFRVVEVHAAHGYLLHEFLSPVTNRREDAYGGDFEGRTRLLREAVAAVRDRFDGAVLVRVSATDWLPDRDSWTLEDAVRLAGTLDCDLVDVSSGGIHPDQQVPAAGPHYMTPYAERVRREAGVRTGAVGEITTPEGADEVIRNGRADLAVVGREHLRDPYFALHAARALGREDGVEVPTQYRRAF
jgi:2,4-dienoyl-CoA reductase-like NADH-dependent reductase (Old Yellow Enzyme family)